MGKRGPAPHDSYKVGKERQRQQDENRHEKAGLPRKHVEANDHPDGEDDSN